MAEVLEMGEVDEMHTNEEGIVLNGDVTKDVEMENRDIEMAEKDVNIESVNINKVQDISESKDVSMDGDKDVEMESGENGTNHSAMDDDSQDSQDSQASRTSQDAKSQGSHDSQDQDSNMESEQIPEESRSLQGVVNEDTNTNSSIPQNVNENSNVSSSVRNEEDSRSSTAETSELKAQDQDPLANALSNENTQESTTESDKKSQNDEQEVSQDGSEAKSESTKNEVSENGTDRPPSAASVQEVKEKPQDPIELNSDDDGDVEFIEAPKTNGTEVIDLVDTTPEKKPKSNDEEEDKPEAITPRRSSRNLNKSKSYVEEEKADTPPPPPPPVESEESDIEEVMPQDPLAVGDQITVERIPNTKKPPPEAVSTIVVKDTKKLVEIATKTNQSTPPTTQPVKKEPTLVIIDTNSILSGRGPVPVPVPSPKPPTQQPISTSNFTSVLPVAAVPAQGMYPPNMRATITPIPSAAMSVQNKMPQLIAAPPTMQSPVAPLLPTLTDDMFVVEAPSFIVPYVYEKPPVKVLKDFVADIKKHIQESKKERKERRAKEKAEKLEKEKAAKIEKEQAENEKKDDVKKEDETAIKKEKDGGSDATYSTDSESEDEKPPEPDPKKPYSYFESPLGKFFVDIGLNMVQEYVQSDLLKQQKRKRDREQGSNPETNKTIASLMKNIEMSRGTNERFKMEIKKCEFCNFKTESRLAMAYHLETPHMKNFVYKCNFCPYEVRSPHDILFHMEAEHAVRGHLERAPAFHQCPSCPFEDNQKGKLSRHLVICARKFKPDRNLEPPPDWEPPAKIPRMPKMRATGLNATVAAYQSLAASKGQQYQFLSKMQLQANAAAASAINRGRGRPSLGPTVKPQQTMLRPQNMIFKQQAGGQVLVPANYQLAGNQVFQAAQAAQAQQVQQAAAAKKPSNTPSISITPLPRGPAASPAAAASKPGDTSSKNSFVICEICDGYIKDLEQLRNHMQWIHKIKIHPKMIYNRPPLNCQKCQFRFFTDQGLERHLLGSHGLVTSSMQDAANKSKDSGRCPVCGRVYQWKLLNHVARDHNMTLKPAHLSYKCTVCTATFGMYKQFENHVYSAHSVVAKRVMDKKTTSGASPSTAKNATEMKPLKINDEITIIPQPAKSTNGAKDGSSPAAPKVAAGTSKNEEESASIALSRAERLARRNATSTAETG